MSTHIGERLVGLVGSVEGSNVMGFRAAVDVKWTDDLIKVELQQRLIIGLQTSLRCGLIRVPGSLCDSAFIELAVEE